MADALAELRELRARDTQRKVEIIGLKTENETMSKQKQRLESSEALVQHLWQEGALKTDSEGNITIVQDPEEMQQMKQQWELQRQMALQQQQQSSLLQ